MAEEIKTLTVKMGGDATGVQKAATASQAALMETAKVSVQASQKVATASEDAAKRIIAGARAGSGMSKALAKSAKQANVLKRELTAAENIAKRKVTVLRAVAAAQKKAADETKRLKQEARKAADQIKRIKQEGLGAAAAMKSIGVGTRNFGRTLSRTVTLPIIALSAVSIKAAADAEEVRSKFGFVFTDIGEQAERAADTLSENFKLAGSSSRELLANTGDLLTGFGFSQKAALDMSLQVQALAGDLASFTNLQGGTKRASDAITRALLGEREGIKSLGKTVLEKDVIDRVAILTAQGVTFETNRQARAVVTLQLITEQSKNAVGDFARTQESLANRTKIAGEAFRDASEAFGDFLINGFKVADVVADITKFLKNLTKQMSELDSIQRAQILGFIKFAVVAGPVLIVLGSLITAVGVISGALTTMIVAFKTATVAVALSGATMALVVIAAAALAAAFVKLNLETKQLEKSMERLSDQQAEIGDKFGGIRSTEGLAALRKSLAGLIDVEPTIKSLDRLLAKRDELVMASESRPLTVLEAGQIAIIDKTIERFQALVQAQNVVDPVKSGFFQTKKDTEAQEQFEKNLRKGQLSQLNNEQKINRLIEERQALTIKIAAAQEGSEAFFALQQQALDVENRLSKAARERVDAIKEANEIEVVQTGFAGAAERGSAEAFSAINRQRFPDDNRKDIKKTADNTDELVDLAQSEIQLLGNIAFSTDIKTVEIL